MQKNEEMACGMEVGGHITEWKEDSPLLFDDSFEHRVWNYAESERVILLFDIWHPGTYNDR